MNFNFLVPKAQKLLTKNVESRYQHFTFLLGKGNKVVCVGWNQKTTHPIADAYGYERSIHSEVHCILKSRHFIGAELRKYTMVNVLLRKKRIKISKPCPLCQNFLQDFMPKAIYYSLEGGGWGRFN